MPPPASGRRITQVPRFGYDAVLVDDDVVVVYDEQTFDGWYYFTGAPWARAWVAR